MTEEGLGPSDLVVTAFEGLVPAEWRQAWDTSPTPIGITIGPQHRLAYQNLASRAAFGTRTLGMPLCEAFPEAVDANLEPLTRVLETGETIDVAPRLVSVRSQVGDALLMRYVLAPFGKPPVGVVITAVDVSAAARAGQALARTRLLADISTRMTDATDAGQALQGLTDALVPEVADLAAVYVVPDPANGPTDPGAHPLPPEVATLSPALAALGPLPTPRPRDGPSPWDALLRSGTAITIQVDDTTIPALAPDPAAACWLRSAVAHSIAVVPLVVAGTLTGAMVLVATADRTPFCDGDLPFLEDVTARAGAAISQVRIAREHRDIALGLQRALLPPAPPALPGMSVAARYIAGAPQVQVGGDWWDVHDLGEGRVGVGIGDVAGRGIPAAAVMGQASAAMRAGSQAKLPPSGVLSVLDGLLADVIAAWGSGETAPQFATASYAVVDTQRRRVRVANAGHLPLLILGPDGRAHVVAVPSGPPLGLGIGGFVEADIPFGPGDTLVMFTDGLVESRTQDLDGGIQQLAALLERLGGDTDLERVAERLLHGMGRKHGHGPDDVALVLLRLNPAGARGAAGSVMVTA